MVIPVCSLWRALCWFRSFYLNNGSAVNTCRHSIYLYGGISYCCMLEGNAGRLYVFVRFISFAQGHSINNAALWHHPFFHCISRWQWQYEKEPKCSSPQPRAFPEGSWSLLGYVGHVIASGLSQGLLSAGHSSTLKPLPGGMLSLVSTERYSSVWYGTHQNGTPRSGLHFHSTLLGGGVICRCHFFLQVKINFSCIKPVEIHTRFTVFEDPVITKAFAITQEKQKQMNYGWCLFTLPYKYEMYVTNPLKSLQFVILAFKVDWLIHGVTCALNNMQENIPPFFH